MKTIINGPPTDTRSRGFPRRRIAVFAAAAAAACILLVAAVVLPAWGDVPGAPGSDVAVSELDGLGQPQAMLDDYSGDYDSGLAAMQADPAGSNSSPEIRIEPSGQLAYSGGLSVLGDPVQLADTPVSDVSDDTGDGAGIDVDVDAVAVPAGTKPDPESGAAEPVSAPAASDPDLSAILAEMAAIRQELELERQAREAAEAAVAAAAQAKPETGVESTPEPVETDPPSWLFVDQDVGVVNTDAGNAPPDWLVDTLDIAVWDNPYDGGPLCRANFAQVPCPLDNADTRMYVEFGAPLRNLTQGDLLQFVSQSVRTCDAGWATIVGSDGKGIQFPGCNYITVPYGWLDEYGQVTRVICFITLTENGYEVVPAYG